MMAVLESVRFPDLAWVVVTISTSYIFYRHLTNTFNYFSDQGIRGPKPFPFFGNLWGVWKVNLPQYDQELMTKYGKVVGYFDGPCPNLLVTDTEIIKSVFVKDFDHFINRKVLALKSRVVRKFLTLLRDQDWKDVRSSVTPAFTTGKIKRMSPMIVECTKRLRAKLEDIASAVGKFDTKSKFDAFAMDVIARCAFGMAIDNLGAEDDPFIRNAKLIFHNPISKSALIILPIAYPQSLSFIAEHLVQKGGFPFFINILKNLIKERNQNKEEYHDFVDAVTESIATYTKESNGKIVPFWNKEEVEEIVISQSTIFLAAGFETTASTLSNIICQLAKNSVVQEKLYEEIVRRFEQFGEVSHEMILDFPYMDQVIHEVMRLYPALPRIERECNKDITIKGIKIKKGMLVSVPTYALHYDPAYYPDPFLFDPDRWSSENKPKLNPYAYMPFGMGPRNCIGMRFAMEELKIAICVLLKDFCFFPVEETPEKMKFEEGFFQIVQPIQTTVGISPRQ